MGLDVLWLAGTRPETTKGVVTQVRLTSSANNVSGAITPTNGSGLVVCLNALWAGSSPAVSPATPSTGLIQAYSGIAGNSLGARLVRYAVPSGTADLTSAVAFSQAGTSRGALLIELVR